VEGTKEELRREYARLWRLRRNGLIPADTPLPSTATKRKPNRVGEDGRCNRPASSEDERRARRREQSARRYAENPGAAKEEQRRHRELHRDRYRARTRINKRIARGLIVRPDSCSACAVPCVPQAHHHRGYDRPLDVIWLCRRCHFEADSAAGSFSKKERRPSRAA
jgi:hypothetical protein